MDPRILLRYKHNNLALKLYYISKLEKEIKQRFDLDKLSDRECIRLFRFRKEQIKYLRCLLQIPFKVRCPDRTCCDGVEGLCILLRRLSYPNRLVDLKFRFHRSEACLSMISNTVLNHIDDNFGHLLTSLDQSWLSQEYFQKYADAIAAKGSPLNHCWGFIDGTVRPICRPGKYQKDCYNGHKRTHALKYQSVVTPNGLIANLFGPIEGRRHDAFLLSQSELLPKLLMKNEGLQDPFYLYGDPAYPLRKELQGPFKGANLTVEQQLFNKKMSMCRIAVEWAFGKVVCKWAFIDFKKNQRLFLQAVGKQYRVAAILVNAHTCMSGNQISNFFGVDPPSIEEYLVPRP